ncbi:hypothetical protein F441_02211 [Phytophthora nicotianae CJ01A1]|uniref:Uncharacterized protein n=3 Tax=Phytophthora nicotianae TaxID=4792 RepID=W2QNR2_PHYN3|nr:hypothetical protein PPTG_22014 [Phytophthora nicotianae INRA-310]ETK94883.1 hypothetical protein L915_02147 [Phytophthora nicotianae]ETN14802.1 hypothetical protein PPTG_22014 [Phytophthora nicotianae INRA-310]ETP24869.1 hypothetical protein F441_02211 [Phytophthora nicotianae CJ01A1]
MAALKFFANVSMHCSKVLIEIGGHLLIMRVSRLSTAVVGMLHPPHSLEAVVRLQRDEIKALQRSQTSPHSEGAWW